jgi:hypothetical protein
MAGFEFRYRLSGASPTIQQVVTTTTAWKKGDTVLIDVNSRAAIGVSGSVTFLGVCQADYTGLTAGTDKIDVLTDADAVFAVTDANARNIKATLDLSGATGAQTVATSSNKEFVVVATKNASTDKTLVRWNVGKHINNVAQ